MKINFKLDIKNIFRIIYIVFFVANIVCLIMLYNFFTNYVYDTIAFDKNSALYQSLKKDDINMDKFNQAIKNIQNK